VRCERHVAVRRLPDMTNDARLEVRLPAQHRRALEQLAAETQLSIGVLTRLALARLVNDDRKSLLELIGKQEAA
jgi:hypothetical protein